MATIVGMLASMSKDAEARLTSHRTRGCSIPILDVESVNGRTATPWNLPQRRLLERSGNKSAVALSMPAGWRPSRLARTGSKSTNHDLNSAAPSPPASHSSAGSARSCRPALTIWAMVRCVVSGGKGSSKSAKRVTRQARIRCAVLEMVQPNVLDQIVEVAEV